ncbi:hypothetical protein [Cupriavidus sp. 2SB]|uniref:hypothetical protein n=1 Tax=Cupriavidus sp. 2SB TaxID=2502199 RepID=UPI0010F9DF5B|nr:hypothetical protein [Cupriavidus sp. 2SB]
MQWRSSILRVSAYLTWCVPLLGNAASTDAPSNDVPRGAYMASQCTRASQCPRFDDAYATTPAFRHALSLALRHANQDVPVWVKGKLPGASTHRDSPSGSASPMLPLRIDDQPYVLGTMADPENPDHNIAALYDTQRGFITVHYVNPSGEELLIGDSTEILRKVMVDYLNPASAFSRSLVRPDVALPIPVSSK